LPLQARRTYNPTVQNSDLDRDGDTDSDDNVPPTNDNDSFPDTGQATRGLPSLGFTNVATALYGDDGELWMDYITLDRTTVSYDDQWDFELNHANNNLSSHNGNNDYRPYLMCRTFGPDVIVNPYVIIGANSDTSIAPDDVKGNALVPAECAQYGVATSIRFDGPTPVSSVP
jgi:hypothetical protein